jgi:hypothetical protein
MANTSFVFNRIRAMETTAVSCTLAESYQPHAVTRKPGRQFEIPMAGPNVRHGRSRNCWAESPKPAVCYGWIGGRAKQQKLLNSRPIRRPCCGLDDAVGSDARAEVRMASQPATEESKKFQSETVTKLRTLAHDLSNSIETIMQASYLLAQAKLDDNNRKWLDLIDQASQDAARINREIREILRTQN